MQCAWKQVYKEKTKCTSRNPSRRDRSRCRELLICIQRTPMAISSLWELTGGTWSREGHSRGWRSSCRRHNRSWEGKLQQPLTMLVNYILIGVLSTYNPLAGDIADLPATLVGSAGVGTRLAAAGRRGGDGGESSDGDGGELHVCGWWFVWRSVFWASVVCRM